MCGSTDDVQPRQHVPAVIVPDRIESPASRNVVTHQRRNAVLECIGSHGFPLAIYDLHGLFRP